MKSITQQLAAAAALVSTAAAQIINGLTNLNGINNYPQGYPYCAQNCLNQYSNINFQQVCQLNAINLANCIQGTCSESDKNNFYGYMNTNCQNNGITLNYAPYNSYNNVNPGFGTNYIYPTPGPNYNGQWPPSGSLGAAFSSYMAAHPNGPNSGDWAAFTSQFGLTSGPWGSATPTGPWGSYATGNYNGMMNGMFGMGFGNGGWSPGNGGPFGGAYGPFQTNGNWQQGPWTSWWNNNQCPASNWPGWTSGAWSTNPPWTTWSACTAQVTSTQVITTIVNGQPFVTSSFGYRVAQASPTGSNLPIPTNVNAASKNGKTFVGGAAVAGLLGVIAAL